MHLHAGSKPFKCSYCSSRFNLKGNLSRHMKVKHGMDVSPEGQGEEVLTKPLLKLKFSDQEIRLLHFWPLICLSDAPPDLEPHEDYEEDNFNFAAPENMDANDAPNLTKLSEVAIQELDYYNFGKDVGSYNTAWALWIRLKLKYC